MVKNGHVRQPLGILTILGVVRPPLSSPGGKNENIFFENLVKFFFGFFFVFMSLGYVLNIPLSTGPVSVRPCVNTGHLSLKAPTVAIVGSNGHFGAPFDHRFANLQNSHFLPLLAAILCLFWAKMDQLRLWA